ncbi:MAG: hypothetical protein IJ877_08340 [Candidatus Gastranaerophilales bacterium]|nr:hypothetical protein [Candidatus Gastranaerophilales bacterium]
MVDSIEIRLDQLTQAIKGLYAKSSMSQGEIYNALTSLSQRYENLTNVSSEKIAATLINEFRKTIDSKYGQTNQFLKDLENSLKAFLQTQQAQNPKTAAEITRLLNDTANIYSKLNSQDLALQKIFDSVEIQRNNPQNTEELTKLSENFRTFSQGFENITMTLNKNFADFLSQLRENSTKDEFSNLTSEINTISGNVNSIISAITVIDSKYRDLSGLVASVQQRDNLFNDALSEVKHLTTTIETIKETIKSIDSRPEIEALSSDIKSQIENVKYEIQKVINTSNSDNEFKTELYNLSGNVSGIQNNVASLSSNITNAQDTIRNLSTNVEGLENEVKNVRNLINDEILYKSRQNDNEFHHYLNSTKEEIKTLLVGLTAFKKDLTAINEGNIKVLQEPIERALEELKDKNIGKTLRELSDGLRDVTLEIQSSVQNMQNSLTDMNATSSMQILTQISEAIPTIADKLEIFRTHVVTENSANLGEIKTSFSQTIAEFKENLQKGIEKIQEDTKTINIETTDTLKVDLQRLSDSITDNVESVNDRIQKEFSDFKGEFSEFSIKQNDNVEKLQDKLAMLEVGLDNLTQETIEKVSDTININSAHSQDVLNEIKSDILEGIANNDRSTKNSITQFELKIDKLLDSYIGADLDNIVERKSLRETIIDIEAKVDRSNLQQIHNAKELLEEIQATTQNLNTKITAIEESKNIATIIGAITKISDRLQGIETFNTNFEDELKRLQEQTDQKLKDNIQKISTLIEKTPKEDNTNKENPELNNLSNKVSEYLSNFEFLKSNISQEIKENLASEFNKVEQLIKKISSQDEKSNYSYTLEDVESDIANLRIAVDKSSSNSDEIKNIFEKVIELRTVGLENVKLNRDVETQISHLQGWIKDTVSKIDSMQERIDDLQSTGFEDIKTRLVQSEKSKLNSVEFAGRVENTLKLMIKNSRMQDEKMLELSKKMDLLTQAQAEGFNPNQFIDIFYDNMTQTKMLSNRVEIIEDKINSIQNAVEKLLSYVEQ